MCLAAVNEEGRATNDPISRSTAHVPYAAIRGRDSSEGRQERLGHSTIALTMDTYSHVIPTMQQEASGGLNDMLKKAIG